MDQAQWGCCAMEEEMAYTSENRIDLRGSVEIKNLYLRFTRFNGILYRRI
jgi:hypothetical protein